MINLRYHIVSLVAVFLALGMGILAGSTFIDKVTVETLNNRLEDVRGSVARIREENQRLAAQVAQGRSFADQARALVVRGELQGVPVLVAAVEGVDRAPVDALRTALGEAGASLAGTVWFGPRMRLVNDAEVSAFSDVVAVAPEVARESREQALARLAEPGRLAALVAAGYAQYEPPPAGRPPDGEAPATSVVASPPALGSLPLSGTRFVVVSGAGASVGDDLLALPLAQALAARANRVVAAEAGQDSPGGRGVFVGALRARSGVATRVSTVDNLESSMGQAAAVLALEQEAGAPADHFGVGPGSQRLLPERG